MTESSAGTVPLTIGIVLYPGFTLLDLAGPQYALGLQGQTYLFWKNHEAVTSDTGPLLTPTTSFSEFTGKLDVLMIPGGFGVGDALDDEEIIDFVARVAKDARYVTSVCTGSLVLAKAGLLKGRRAATHWLYHDVLEALGAVPVRERVVVDGNIFTGGGVTAGLDFGLTLLAVLRGETVAKVTELAMEYDPNPPFKIGHPSKAPPELIEAAREVSVVITAARSWIATSEA
jgi:cyclohexyl-isocyanide hydratase